MRLEVEEAGVAIEASAETTAQTGVEMEALTAASVAALTVYDMAKAIDKEMVVEDVRLVEKTRRSSSEGGRPHRLGRRLRAASARTRAARSWPSLLAGAGYEVERRVVPDERDAIAGALRELAGSAQVVLTTGGTGFGPARRDAGGDPGRPRARGARASPRRSAPTRSPGRRTVCSPAAWRVWPARRSSSTSRLARRRRDGFAVLRPALAHALELLAGEPTAHVQT